MPRCFQYLSQALLLSVFVTGCFQKNDFPFTDNDGDEFAVEFGDCDDNDPNVNPDEDEDCNEVDDNCDGLVDEDFDADGDGFVADDINGCDIDIEDCDDDNEDVFPGGIEIDGDGLDNDCNGFIDDGLLDNDNDGFCENDFACNDASLPGDCDDGQAVVNANAFEFVGDNVDNNCDGNIDELFVACDGNVNNASTDPFDFAEAIELCQGEVQAAVFNGNRRAIRQDYGTGLVPGTMYVPVFGDKMILLSSGFNNTNDHDLGQAVDGANGGACAQVAHPFPQNAGADGCSQTDPANVCDRTELVLTLKAPSNAQSFKFNFQFLSSEYPTFRCTQFDDTFLALVENSAALNDVRTNVSFDNNGNVVSVNNGFFEICEDDLQDTPRDIDQDGTIENGEVVPFTNDCSVEDGTALNGTGFVFNGDPDGNSDGAGATKTLTTIVPVTPNDTFTIRFVIFDEGDDILDSVVLIDNFQWDLQPAEEPVTLE